jgi:hypothetical protein
MCAPSSYHSGCGTCNCADLFLVSIDNLVQELLQKDFDMLNFFRTDPACRVQVQGPPGVPVQVFEPRWACAANNRSDLHKHGQQHAS